MDERITYFAYDQMVESALRSVLREALMVTQKQGLPSRHHFYITFNTDYPGLVISPQLKSRHPGSMTIVLQNQFWDLDVHNDFFEVCLSFGGKREHLSIPFAAVTAFADPHASFGLQFRALSEDGDEPHDDTPGEGGDGSAEMIHIFSPEQNPPSSLEKAEPAAQPAAHGDTPANKGKPDPAAQGENSSTQAEPSNVITLDRFRKKPG